LTSFFVAGESICRAVPVFRYQDEPPIHREDAELGWVLIPNSRFTHKKPCFNVEVKINSYGLRDEEFSLEKDKGTYRILVLGDSLTFGVGVENQDSYPEQLEEILNSKMQDRYRYEVVNAGVYGWGTHQEYKYLKRKGFDFDPNLIIVAFYSNDIEEVYVGDSKRGLSFQPQFAFKKFLSKHSYFYRFLRIQYNLLLIRMGMRYPAVFFAKPQDLLSDSYPKDLEVAFDKTKDYIIKLNELAMRKNIKVIFALLPAAFEILGKTDSELINAIEKSRLFNYKFLSLYKLKVYNEIQNFLKDNNIPTIDLLPIFVDAYKQTSLDYLFIKCDTHYTKDAHRIVAESIYDFIDNGGFIP
jgi:lysophospholipase L1-like esterase